MLPNTTINVVLASKPNEPVQVVTTSETGYANATIPVVRPPVPTNISMTVAGNKATIVGKGEAGMKITVFDDNGKLFGSAVVQPDGSFSVTTTYLGSGSYPMNITQTDDKGGEFILPRVSMRSRARKLTAAITSSIFHPIPLLQSSLIPSKSELPSF